MATTSLILLAVFLLLLVMDVPIAVAIAMATFAAMLAYGIDPTTAVAEGVFNGVNKFTLLAIPFFILSGHLMGRGGMATRLIDFAGTLVGFLPGGLAYVNTLTCMLFGSISGSAAAAVSSVGGFMIPEMNRKGYDRDFNVAVTTTAATTGLLIPPSNIMIIYSVAAGSASISAMFMAGILPGILSGVFIMLVCCGFAYTKNYPREPRATFKEILVGFKRAFLSLFLIVIVIGGILAGIFTATEAAAIAVVYAFLLAVVLYREVKLTDIPELLRLTGITTAIVMLLIGVSSSLSWIMTITNIPQTVSAVLLGLSDNPILILLTINVLVVVRWDVHGHGSCGIDLHSDFLAGRGGFRNARGAFWDHDDCKPLHRTLYSAGGNLFVYWLRGWQDDDRKSNHHNAAVLRFDGLCIDDHHLRARHFALVARANQTTKSKGRRGSLLHEFNR